MKDYQHAFIEFAVEQKALCFGKFTLKSGRVSPYFFNAGLFNNGESLARLGKYYAQTIIDSGTDYDVLYGPAYKGIPLVAATAIALSQATRQSTPYAFNRKEAKDHAEGGTTVGATLSGNVIIIDDVISAGISVAESVDLIRRHDARPAGVFIALDRQERDRDSSLSATQQIEQSYDLPVHAIVTLDKLIEFLATSGDHGEHLTAISQYKISYGC